MNDPKPTPIKTVLAALLASAVSGAVAVAGRALWKAWRAAGKTELELAVEEAERVHKEIEQAKKDVAAAAETDDPKDDVAAKAREARAEELQKKSDKHLALVRRLKAIGDAIADAAEGPRDVSGNEARPGDGKDP